MYIKRQIVLHCPQTRNAIGYAMHSNRSHDSVVRVYDDTGNVIETHQHKGDFKGAISKSTALLIVQDGLRCDFAHL